MWSAGGRRAVADRQVFGYVFGGAAVSQVQRMMSWLRGFAGVRICGPRGREVRRGEASLG